MLLFTGWMQTHGTSSNSCGAVCETVIVSGKLSQKSLCSSGLKAAGVEGEGAGGVKLDVKFSAATWCVQRWSQRWNSESESALSPCCCCCWIFEKAQTHTDPRVGCTGQGPPPQAETWAMADAPEPSAVPCPTCPEQIDYSFRTCLAFFPPSTEDGWIFPPCFLFGDGLFADSIASLHLFKCGATDEHL